MSIFASTGRADDRDAFEALTYVNAQGQKLPYRLLKPVGYDAARRYPLVVFFHGAGECGDDNRIQLVHGMAVFASADMRAKYPAFVVAPQCPSKYQWVDVDWGSTRHDMAAKPTTALQLTLDLVTSLEKQYSIDADRIYLTGLSMGGYGVWDALQRYPERFAAAIPICGGGDTKFADKLKPIPTWAFHGAKDTAVPVQRSRQMIDAIKSAGGMPKYTEYSDVGHDSWTATYQNPDVYAWLFSQRRTRKTPK